MAKHSDNGVISGLAMIIWDGITQPEEKTDGTGKYLQYSLRVAVPNTAPELAELQAIAQAALAADSTFKGQLPPGGNWPLQPVDPAKFEGRLPTHMAFNCKSRRVPQVYDANGQELNPMVYSPQLYPGAIVQVLVNAYTFNNVSKGVTFGLSGIRIVDATAPHLPVGGLDAGAVFGVPQGGAPTGPNVAPPPAAYQPPPAAYQPPPAAYQPPPAAYQPPPAASPAGYPAGGVQPAPNFLAPPPAAVGLPPAPVGPQMTAKAAGQTHAQFVAAGWTDELLRQHGYML
jgi:hypothetical protein